MFCLPSIQVVLVPQEVKNSTVAFLLLRIPTLKIKTVAKKEVFEANLKSECDLWHLMVKEMWAGKQLADDHKVCLRWGRSCGHGWHQVLKGASRAYSTWKGELCCLQGHRGCCPET